LEKTDKEEELAGNEKETFEAKIWISQTSAQGNCQQEADNTRSREGFGRSADKVHVS
jgi:hypothetical protein